MPKNDLHAFAKTKTQNDANVEITENGLEARFFVISDVYIYV